jgi:hypothetical protein
MGSLNLHQTVIITPVQISAQRARHHIPGFFYFLLQLTYTRRRLDPQFSHRLLSTALPTPPRNSDSQPPSGTQIAPAVVPVLSSTYNPAFTSVQLHRHRVFPNSLHTQSYPL